MDSDVKTEGGVAAVPGIGTITSSQPCEGEPAEVDLGSIQPLEPVDTILDMDSKEIQS